MDAPRAAHRDKGRISSRPMYPELTLLISGLQQGLEKLLLRRQGLSPEITQREGSARWFCHHISLILSSASGPGICHEDDRMAAG